MGEKRYMISDTSKVLKVESHVLRYWEEELEISIPRNEMGHRYYTENHINLLRNVRNLKQQGYGLRAIKMMLTDPKDLKKLPDTTLQNNKMEQFQTIMGDIVSNALKESTGDMTKKVSEEVSQSVLKGMNYIMRVQEEKEEARYKKLDETIRGKQKISKKEARKLAKSQKVEKKKKIINFRKTKKPQTT